MIGGERVRQILIIEDDISLCRYLIKKAKEINPNIDIKSTDSAKDALEIAHECDITAFFIDIQLLDYSGLELAKQIRGLDKYQFTPMVFITAVPTRELEAFRQVHCYEYIIKPFTDDELTNVFEKILIQYVERVQSHTKKICLDRNGVRQLIHANDIVLVEYSLRRVVLHFKNSILKYKHMPLKKFAEQLPDYFIQIHQSIIINKNFIQSIDYVNNYVVLEYIDIKLPIGKSYRKKAGELVN